MEGTKNNGTNMGEPSVHFKVGDPDLVRVGSLSSSPARQPKSGCLNLPILFERAGSFFPTPKFDSEILETEQWKSYFPQTHRRFQYALIYVLVACIVWAVYFGIFNETAHHWPYFLIGTIILFVVVASVLGFTYTRHYEKLYLVTSVFVSVLICVAVLLTLIYTESDLSTFGAFTATVELLLMIYSVIPMPMIVTVIFGVMYSIVFEVFNLMQNHHMQEPVFIAGKILLHLCIHIMGVHIFTMRQVRQHSTFLKIGQSAIVRQDLEFEKQIKEKMIHSLMPPSVASQVIKSRADKDEEAAANDVQTKKRNSKTKTPGRGEIIFRTFNMNRMENVSILFADIVGFTKMSSNKTAERLVGLLNDLFGRFDDLCTQTGCEKISTLGDCYYCVAGCPTPKPDHAKCCVEMGLGMIEAIKQFDIDNNEEVNMRVGVHTGTVLCGIVGTRRFKFDVWSNDVILANNMESTGEPGRVHISETSLVFLKDEYEVEPGPDCEDNRSERKLVEAYDKNTSQYAVKHATWDKMIKTYFIVGYKKKDGAKPDQSVGNTAEVQPETVAISMEGENGPTESDTLMNDALREQQDANGIMTTLSSHLNNSLNNLDEKAIGKELSDQPSKNCPPPKISNGNDICNSSLPNPLDMCRQPATLNNIHASPDLSSDLRDVDHPAIVLVATLVNDLNNQGTGLKSQVQETVTIDEIHDGGTSHSGQVLLSTVVHETNNMGTSHTSQIPETASLNGINNVGTSHSSHVSETNTVNETNDVGTSHTRQVPKTNETKNEGTSHSSQVLQATDDNEANIEGTSHSSQVKEAAIIVNESNNSFASIDCTSQVLNATVVNEAHIVDTSQANQVLEASNVNETNNFGTSNMFQVQDTTPINRGNNDGTSDTSHIPEVTCANETNSVGIWNSSQMLDAVVVSETNSIDTSHTSQIVDTAVDNETNADYTRDGLSVQNIYSNEAEISKTIGNKDDKKHRAHVPNPNGEVVMTTSVSDPNLSRSGSVNRDLKCNTYLQDRKLLSEVLRSGGGISTRWRSVKSSNSLECYYRRGAPSLSRDSSPGSSGHPSPKIRRPKRQSLSGHMDEKSPRFHHEQFENFFNPSPKTSPGGRNRIYVPLSGSSTPQVTPSPTVVQLPVPEDGQLSILSAVTSVGLSVMRFGEICTITGEMYDISLEPMNQTFSKIRNINHHSDVNKTMDLHIVKCIQEGIKDKEYLYKPPINQFTLAFTDKNLEENYRDHYLGEEHTQRTISAPIYLSFLEIIVSFVVFIIVSIFCFVVFDMQTPWIIFFCVSLFLEILNIIRGYMAIKQAENKEKGFWNKMMNVTSGWYLRNFLGAVIASLPLLAVFVNFSCNLMQSSEWTDRFFCFCIIVSLVHYTNFTTLSSWMKSIIVFLAGVVLIVLITVVKCTTYVDVSVSTISPVTATQIVIANSSFPNVTDDNSNMNISSKAYIPLFSGLHIVQSYTFFEIIIDMLLLVFLIGFLNRESEISYRLNYHGDAQAWEYKQIMQENKDQADWLLHNIIPPHVSEVVRETSKYSKNHTDVGVIFAAIVNFNEIYDESYEGGREFLRVLNELVSDYEDLLDEKRFKDVEKIKTISSTFMAASGLNEISRGQNGNPKSHLYALLEFSTELQNCISRFNDSLFNFDFIMNIGFNFGEVTAGVIGTTKLLYDIWGDTVNIASRMYSTGVAERIQVPEACAQALGDKMEFEYRGEITVKGKGVMRTFLYSRTKDGASWPWE